VSSFLTANQHTYRLFSAIKGAFLTLEPVRG